MFDHFRSDEKREKEFLVMADIDVKFMKGNRALQKQMGSTYKSKKTGMRKTAKPKGKK